MSGGGPPRDRGQDWPAWLRGAGRDWISSWPGLVLVVGAIVTAGLALGAMALNASNERRLLRLRAKEVAAELTAALPGIQTSLSSAAALADATRADPVKFARLIGPEVGSAPGQQFVSVSLWSVRDPGRGPLATVGVAPELEANHAAAAPFFAHTSATAGLTVISLLNPPLPRLGFAFTGPAPGPYAAYGESAIPRDRLQKVQAGAAFSDLNYDLFLGQKPDPAALLLQSSRQLPLPDPRATSTVPFGDAFFTVVVSPRHPLGGSLPQSLPWIIAVLGSLLTLAAMVLTGRLVSRRREAETLATQIEQVAVENRRLYTEQRGIAETLQKSLLPDVLPDLPDLDVAARYDAGVEGIEVGGDWYDLISLEGDRLLLVVGDVSGRGLPAATSMASLRFAIHYAAQEETPESFLPKLSSMRRLLVNGQIATLLCAMIDLPTREVTVTSAGHLPLLMVAGSDSRFLTVEVGPPVGVDHRATYSPRTFRLPPRATLVGYTDGLVERRDEVLDEGLERLRAAAAGQTGTLEQVIARILAAVRDPRSHDDTAITAIRWRS